MLLKVLMVLQFNRLSRQQFSVVQVAKIKV